MKKNKFETFEQVLHELETYNDNTENVIDITNDLQNIHQLINSQEFSIAVIANMSSGKSTFINALFGDDVLPAFTEATTDCVTYIYSDDDDSNNQAVIHFEDEKQPCTIALENVKKELKHYAKKDSPTIDDKYKKVNKIELDWDFVNINTSTDSKIKVTFIDTPGPNNTGDFALKHKNQTGELIKSIDMVIFLFDYIQLDANLSSDEQGIWSQLKKRKEKDENFGIYFVINKIDAALEDLMADTKDTEDKEVRKELRQEQWTNAKNKAIQKIQVAASKHGFEDANIYTVASSWALLDRKKKDEDEDDDLDDIKKKKFKRVWDDDYENKFYEFLGLSKLESDINDFIKTQIEEKIFNKIYFYIQQLIQNKMLLLEKELQLSKQGEDEVRKNIDNTKLYIDEEIPNQLMSYHKVQDKIKSDFMENIRILLKEKFADYYSKDILIEIVLYMSSCAEILSINNNYFLENLTDIQTAEFITQVDNLHNETTLRKLDELKFPIPADKQDAFIQYYYDFARGMASAEQFEAEIKDELSEHFNSTVHKLAGEYELSKDYIETEINKHLNISFDYEENQGGESTDINNTETDWLKTGSIIAGGAIVGAMLPAIAIGGAIGWGIGSVFGIGLNKLNEDKITIDEQDTYEWLDSISKDYFSKIEPSILNDFETNFNILDDFSKKIFYDLQKEKKQEILILANNLLMMKENTSQSQTALNNLQKILKLLE